MVTFFAWVKILSDWRRDAGWLTIHCDPEILSNGIVNSILENADKNDYNLIILFGGLDVYLDDKIQQK